MNNFYPKKGSLVAVALSGGVDSGVAAKLLVDKGYKVKGFWMWLFGDKKAIGFKQAKKLSQCLNIPFYTIDLRDDFKKQVIDYFIDSYKTGKTPNPCIVCNQKIKFDKAYGWAQKKLKVDYLATGHYVRKYQTDGLKYKLFSSKDKTKDQSYFLYAINKKLIDKLVFPIGDYKRFEVEEMANKWNLPVAKSKKSVDICFATDWQDFLKKNIKNNLKKGDVFNTKGQKIGIHNGLYLHTIGQKIAFKINPDFKKNKTPKYYLLKKDLKNNKLVVGVHKELFTNKIKLKQCAWFFKPSKNKLKAFIKVRSTGKKTAVQLLIKGSGAEITMSKKVFAVAPGQSAVCYKKEKNSFYLIGGGIIF